MMGRRWLCLLFMCLAWPAMAAVEFPGRPADGQFFIDEGNMLSEADEARINEIASRLFAERKIPIIVATIPSLDFYGAGGLSIEAYAGQLFDHWGIGSQNFNYGMLVLVSYFDRKARIEFGAAYAQQYNAEAAEVMQVFMIPAFKNYEYGKGLVNAVTALDSLARGLGLPLPEVNWLYIIIGGVVGGLVLMLIVVNLIASGRSGWAWALLAFIGIILFFILKHGGRRGGGGAFGGGSSGGGGASGGW